MGDIIEIIAIEFIDSINAYQVDLYNEPKGEYYRVFIPNKYIEQAKVEDETKQEKSIQMAQDNILAVAQQNQEYREQQVKQAKIDLLKELQRKYGFYTCFSWHHEPKLLGEIIDKMIEDLKDEN